MPRELTERAGIAGPFYIQHFLPERFAEVQLAPSRKRCPAGSLEK